MVWSLVSGELRYMTCFGGRLVVLCIDLSVSSLLRSRLMTRIGLLRVSLWSPVCIILIVVLGLLAMSG